MRTHDPKPEEGPTPAEISPRTDSENVGLAEFSELEKTAVEHIRRETDSQPWATNDSRTADLLVALASRPEVRSVADQLSTLRPAELVHLADRLIQLRKNVGEFNSHPRGKLVAQTVDRMYERAYEFQRGVFESAIIQSLLEWNCHAHLAAARVVATVGTEKEEVLATMIERLHQAAWLSPPNGQPAVPPTLLRPYMEAFVDVMTRPILGGWRLTERIAAVSDAVKGSVNRSLVNICSVAGLSRLVESSYNARVIARYSWNTADALANSIDAVTTGDSTAPALSGLHEVVAQIFETDDLTSLADKVGENPEEAAYREGYADGIKEYLGEAAEVRALASRTHRGLSVEQRAALANDLTKSDLSPQQSKGLTIGWHQLEQGECQRELSVSDAGAPFHTLPGLKPIKSHLRMDPIDAVKIHSATSIDIAALMDGEWARTVRRLDLLVTNSAPLVSAIAASPYLVNVAALTLGSAFSDQTAYTIGNAPFARKLRFIALNKVGRVTSDDTVAASALRVLSNSADLSGVSAVSVQRHVLRDEHIDAVAGRGAKWKLDFLSLRCFEMSHIAAVLLTLPEGATTTLKHLTLSEVRCNASAARWLARNSPWLCNLQDLSLSHCSESLARRLLAAPSLRKLTFDNGDDGAHANFRTPMSAHWLLDVEAEVESLTIKSFHARQICQNVLSAPTFARVTTLGLHTCAMRDADLDNLSRAPQIPYLRELRLSGNLRLSAAALVKFIRNSPFRGTVEFELDQNAGVHGRSPDYGVDPIVKGVREAGLYVVRSPIDILNSHYGPCRIWVKYPSPAMDPPKSASDTSPRGRSWVERLLRR